MKNMPTTNFQSIHDALVTEPKEAAVINLCTAEETELECAERTRTISKRIERVLSAFGNPELQNVGELDSSVISNVLFSPYPEFDVSKQQRKIVFVMLFKSEMTAKEIMRAGGFGATSIYTELQRLVKKGYVIQTEPENPIAKTGVKYSLSNEVLRMAGIGS